MDAGQTNVASVLILGAGINGAAVARELVLNKVPVWLVDNDDLASGATARSSRLIHGGLRYLEYGDIGLVRESLQERSRLLKLAPQFVQPLRLFIPLSTRRSGLLRAGLRFFGLSRTHIGGNILKMLGKERGRGLWPVSFGLSLYDWIARSDLPRHKYHGHGDSQTPACSRRRYHWFCSYSDAQMIYPERFVVSLLQDTRQFAEHNNVSFKVRTYHSTEFLGGGRVRIAPISANGKEDQQTECSEFTPSLIVNASGAAGDATLAELGISAPTFMGGTKGSHFITWNRQLREAIGNNGVYAETDDGRLVFVLPFLDAVLVGTTDIPFSDPPETAVATDEELEYLIELVNRVFEPIVLTRGDVAMHYSGVRPLPSAKAATVAAISRGHSIEELDVDGLPVYTLVGGKLTTCREFGEQVADRIFRQLGITRNLSTGERYLPGAENYPADERQLSDRQQQIANRFGCEIEQIHTMWLLCGAQTEDIVAQFEGDDSRSVAGAQLPRGFVKWVMKNEWVANLSDLVERRLMLLFHPDLSRATLSELGELLVEMGQVSADDVSGEVQHTQDRLEKFYGKQLDSQEP